MPKGRLCYYPCGYTSHQLKQLMHGAPRESRVFPAGVFLYRHPDGRTVLFDTGYAPATWHAGVRGFLYNLLLPAHISPEQSIAAQLSRDGISTEDVNYVVLSHLHPDHIGGVRYFPAATFVMSSPMLQTLSHGALKEGLIPRLLPRWFPTAQKLIVDPGRDGFDLLGDGSYLLLDLPGHARGHMGALIQGQAVLAGDASWGEDLMEVVPRMKAFPRAITYDWDQYKESVGQLQRWKARGLKLYFSHDHQAQKDLLE